MDSEVKDSITNVVERLVERETKIYDEYDKLMNELIQFLKLANGTAYENTPFVEAIKTSVHNSLDRMRNIFVKK